MKAKSCFNFRVTLLIRFRENATLRISLILYWMMFSLKNSKIPRRQTEIVNLEDRQDHGRQKRKRKTNIVHVRTTLHYKLKLE